MNKSALVTLAIGEPYLSNWARICSEKWQAYAARHGFDLIVVTEPFVPSDRSPAWQKCLVLSQDFAQKYRRIVLLDSDIAINPTAPNVLEQAAEEFVGGVLSGSHIHDDLKPLLASRLMNQPIPYERGLRQWNSMQNLAYEEYGLSRQEPGVVQTGVLIASPARHGALFRSIYDGSFTESRSYEQIPLSHALLNAGLFQQIDSRFNSTLYETMLVHHHYLFTDPLGEHVTKSVVRAEFAKNFFLHFAYDQSLIRCLED